MPNVALDITDTILDEHPIFNEENLYLETPAIIDLREKLHRWLWMGATGALIYGMYRIGKTSALFALMYQIYTRGHIQVPCYYVEITDSDRMTLRSVYADTADNLEIDYNRHESGADLRNKIIHYVLDQSKRCKCKRAILFVDEMQRLTIDQMNAFAILYDQLLKKEMLNHHGLRLMTVFVGNDPECWGTVSKITRQKHAHLYGRFFTRKAPFYGITSQKQARSCLAQYDKIRYPHDGPTLTSFVLPEAVESGFKASSLSPLLWKEYRRIVKPGKDESWGMPYFVAAVKTLLADFIPTYGTQCIDEEMIAESIYLSGVLEAEVYED